MIQRNMNKALATPANELLTTITKDLMDNQLTKINGN